ncbi:LppU/SCO3897 family protein [Williamsia sterculiae]|uniref:LppU/SCO3897 family protein n=1 Tax=Williamsia sterculiae TaxID=1344003 RepID=UPI00117E3078|nr:hypothetical protein [Williamsia sterculiae]
MALLVIAGVATAVVLVLQVSRPTIDKVQANDCVSVKGDNSNADVTKVDCQGDFSFTIAEKVGKNDPCPGEQYNRITAQGSDAKLCVVPNFRQGRCYQVPGDSNTRLVDFREIHCGDALAPNTRQVEVFTRTPTDSTADCVDGVSYDRPTAVSYCFDKKVDDLGELNVEDCVNLSRADGLSSSPLEVRKTSCGAKVFSFTVASKVSGTDTCPGYDRVTDLLHGSGMCVVPNMTQGLCYQIPTTSDELTDYTAADCADTPKTDTTVVKVVSRQETTPPTCGDGETPLPYSLPRPVGYCLQTQ